MDTVIDNIESKLKKNRSFWKLVISLEVYMKQTITYGLWYNEDVTFLGNDIVWFWSSLDVQSSDSSVELYNFIFESFFLQISAPVFGKERLPPCQ